MFVSEACHACRVQRPGGESVALLQAAAHLYQAQGHFQLALAILLRLQRPDVFDFVARHGLLGGLKPQQACTALTPAIRRQAKDARAQMLWVSTGASGTLAWD